MCSALASDRSLNAERSFPRLAGYELIARIGSGEKHGSFRAQLVGTRRPAFLQVFKTGKARSSTEREMFTRDRALLLRLEHPHIVHQIGGGWHGDYRYLVMHFVQGDSVEEIVRDYGPLPERAIARIGLKCASALDYLHRRNWLHCGVAPDHLLVGEDGMVKLVGLAASRPADPRRSGGIFVDSPARTCFAAPEILVPGLPLDHRADYYSLGATLYLAAAGKPPFEQSLQSKKGLREVLERMPAAPHSTNPEISQRLSALILDLMRKVPGERPSRIEDICVVLSASVKSDS